MSIKDIADRVALVLLVAFVAWGVTVCAVGLAENLSK